SCTHATRRNLHHALLSLLPGRQGASEEEERRVHRDRRIGRPGFAYEDDRARQWPHHGAADFHRRDPCGRLRRSLRARGWRQARPAIERTGAMTGSTFRVGLVQTRTGRSPQANLDTVAKLIGEAKNAGADYVQTPEMTNIMEVSRDTLFATIVPEESDA